MDQITQAGAAFLQMLTHLMGAAEGYIGWTRDGLGQAGIPEWGQVALLALAVLTLTLIVALNFSGLLRNSLIFILSAVMMLVFQPAVGWFRSDFGQNGAGYWTGTSLLILITLFVLGLSSKVVSTRLRVVPVFLSLFVLAYLVQPWAQNLVASISSHSGVG